MKAVYRFLISDAVDDGVGDMENSLFKTQLHLFDCDNLVFGVQLHSRCSVGRILDNPHKSFIRSLSNRNRLSNGFISSTGAWGRHGGSIRGSSIALHSGIHLGKIRSSRLVICNPTPLGSDGSEIVGPADEHTSIRSLFTIVKEGERSKDVQDDTGSGLSAGFLDSITNADLRAVSICGYVRATV